MQPVRIVCIVKGYGVARECKVLPARRAGVEYCLLIAWRVWRTVSGVRCQMPGVRCQALSSARGLSDKGAPAGGTVAIGAGVRSAQWQDEDSYDAMTVLPRCHLRAEGQAMPLIAHSHTWLFPHLTARLNR